MLEVPIIGRLLLRFFTPTAWIVTVLWVIFQWTGLLIIPIEIMLWGWLAVYCVILSTVLHMWTASVSTSRSNYHREMRYSLFVQGITVSLLTALWATGIGVLAALSWFVYAVLTGFQANLLVLWVALFLMSLLLTELYFSFRRMPIF